MKKIKSNTFQASGTPTTLNYGMGDLEIRRATVVAGSSDSAGGKSLEAKLKARRW